VQWDVTTIVQRLYTGADHGFVIQDHLDESGNKRAQVAASREHATLSERPQLDISFGAGSGADTLSPVAMDIQLTNHAAIVGQAEAGDRITITYSEPLAPTSVLAGWDGSATNVVVAGGNAGIADTFTIRNAADTAQLPVGVISSGADFFAGPASFGAIGTPSTMTLTGSTIVVTLGTPSGTMRTASAARTVLAPESGPTDSVGNPLVIATATESGPLDVDL
jgi:hypothetical protein